ncbi:alginate lyase family protein [Candidatus Electrothrix sp.]|uniref:alginate lyase family protein n=1 Tax=Candidatus Electrothrix sp. TaxID=2170559 RepID=UPI00405763B3
MRWLKLNTYLRLGLPNIATVALYRLAKQAGYYKHRLPVGQPIQGPFFSDTVAEPENCFPFSYFSFHTIQATSPPDWFINPWNGTRCPDSDRHWSAIPDFMPELGDIKTVWEASRFDWLPCMAWAYRNGDKEALARLELWLRDWAKQNPVNSGVNWKCGQEASLRCLNMLAAALSIDKCFDHPFDGFLQFLSTHLQRIVPTLRYAMAQDNNHGVSEAAALFAVGQYLRIHGTPAQQKKAEKWSQQGRSWLENRIKKLIMPDGSFSQHSVTYHRFTLDILSFVELLRIRLEAEPFEALFYERIKAAVRWLHTMTDSRTGDAPNLGPNDGAYLFNLQGGEYRDFRPSIQLGAAVFLQRAAWPNEVNHPLLKVFSCDLSKFPLLNEAGSSIMAQGGYACFRDNSGFALLRLPVYRFRPSHADALHLDLWHNEINWVRDAGSYSYNADEESLQYFPGTVSHNSICFDNRDQMPRLGRFLFGAWLQPDEVSGDMDAGMVRSGYTDYSGAQHIREVQYRQGRCSVTDTFVGFTQEAVIRWHLAPADWKLDNRALFCDQMKLLVEAENDITLSLTELPESRYYLDWHNVLVLEIRSAEAGTVKTSFIFID